MAKLSFNNINPSFSIALKKRVDEYFTSQNIKFTGNGKLFWKTGILFTIVAALYTVLVFFTPPAWISIILCAVLGLTFAAIGFNVMHDGAHGSYSQKRWVNEIMAYSLDLLGGSSYLWKQKHNVIHHSYTNIEGHDDDIDIKPWIRTNEHQPKKWYHRYQHFYWVILYGFNYIVWVFTRDFEKYFTGKIAGMKIKKMSMKDHIIFWGSKALYIFMFIILPGVMVGWVSMLVGYVILAFVCGLSISVVFQLAHVVEEAEFPLPNDSNKVEQDWTVHQLQTTANFATRSRVLSWFTGGLNFQVEHHLFPRISHVHYPAVSKVVKSVCEQFNMKYNEFPSFFSALRSHVLYLKAMGVN